MPVVLYPCILALCFFEFTKAREDKALDQGHCKKVSVHYNFVSPLKCSTLVLHFSHEKDWPPLLKKKFHECSIMLIINFIIAERFNGVRLSKNV